MRTSTLAVLLLATFVLSACGFGFGGQVRGSGNVVTKDLALTDFRGVDAGHNFIVDIQQGSKFSLSVGADDNLWQYLKVEKQGTTLKLYLEQNRSYSGAHLTARITMPALETLSLSGASQATLAGFKSNSALNGNLSGASKLRGTLDTGNVRFEASGASNIALQGSGGDATISASGASMIDLGNFGTGNTSVSLSGGSSSTVKVNGKLDYDISGASHLTYQGQPSIGRANSSGASSATAR